VRVKESKVWPLLYRYMGATPVTGGRCRCPVRITLSMLDTVTLHTQEALYVTTATSKCLLSGVCLFLLYSRRYASLVDVWRGRRAHSPSLLWYLVASAVLFIVAGSNWGCSIVFNR